MLVFPQQLGSISPFCLATRLSKTHQLSSSRQCNKEVSKVSGDCQRQLPWALHSFGFIFFWLWLPKTCSLTEEQWLDGKQSKTNHSSCWHVLELLSPGIGEIWNRREGKLVNTRTGKFWHPKLQDSYKPEVIFSAHLCWDVIIIRISSSQLAFILSQHLISKCYYSLSPFQLISILSLSKAEKNCTLLTQKPVIYLAHKTRQRIRACWFYSAKFLSFASLLDYKQYSNLLP